jgi:guanylate kinase
VAITRRGLMLVISSPSGAGKSTLCRGLLNTHENLEMSISATTRQPRPSERNGVDYHFLSRDDFIERRDKGEFLEWAKVFDNLYGTLRQPVDRALDAGRDVLFDVDWQGAQQLDQAAGEDVVRVFIMPPSKQELERRLRARAEDDAAEVARRMAQFHDEVSRWDAYDYVLINDDLDRAQANLNAILKAERLKRERQVGLSEFVKSLEQEPAATG